MKKRSFSISSSLTVVLFFLILTCSIDAQWIQTNGPVTNNVNISSFGINGTMIFTGAVDKGMFLSTNNGIIWNSFQQSGLTGQYPYALAFSGGNIYMGNLGVWKSTDNGASWTNISSGSFNWNITCLAASGTNIVAGTITQFQGVFCSTNGGTNWVRSLVGYEINGVAISGTNFFAAVSGHTGDNGIFKSTNGGVNWFQSGLASYNIYALSASNDKLYAGSQNNSFVSTNNGSNWTGFATNYGLIHQFAVSGVNIFAGTTLGAYISANLGANWSPAGLVGNVLSLAASGSNVLAGINNSALYYSLNNGTNWITSGLPALSVTAFLLSGTNVFAGTSANGVFLTSDNGYSWVPMNNDLPNLHILSLASSGQYIFAGTTSSGIFRSSNNGVNWIPVNSGLTINAVNTIFVSGNNIFAGLNSNAVTDGGVYLSTNNGTLWTQNGLINKSVNTVTVSGSKVYAGLNAGGTYRSTNGGQNWVYNGLTTSTIKTIVITGSNIYASTPTQGIFKSTLTDTPWIPVNTGLTDYNVTSLCTSGMNVIAGTHSKGIFVSTDNGSLWVTANTSLNYYFDISCLLPANDLLYAGTNGLSVWKRPLSELIGIRQIGSSVPRAYSLSQNYPNPFNPVTRIRFNIPLSRGVPEGRGVYTQLRIFDVLGREVTMLVNEQLNPGTYEVDWDASSYPSGAFFYRLQAGDFSETKKMILMK